MATNKILKNSTKSGYMACLSTDYQWVTDPTNRTWTLQGRMKFYCNATMGEWGDSRGTYYYASGETNDNSSVKLPSGTKGTYYLKPKANNSSYKNLKSGTYDNAGTAPSVTINWKWGAYSSWAGITAPSGSFSVTGPTLTPTAPTITAVSVNVATLGSATVSATISGSYTNVEYSIDNANWQSSATFSVSHNTSYTFYVRANYVAAGGTSAWGTGQTTVTTSGSNPTLTYSTQTISRTTGATTYPSKYQNVIKLTEGYDTNATYSSATFAYSTTSGSYTTSGTVSHSGSTLTCTTASTLNAYTTYYYRAVLTDNFGRTATYTGSFTTDRLVPGNLTLTVTSGSITTSSFSGTVSAVGDTNAPITNYTLYYKASTASSYTSVNLGTTTSWSLTGLAVDTTYLVYFTATNNKGTSTSSATSVSTNLDTPVISSIIAEPLDAFSIRVTVNGYSPSGRPLTYTFSIDGGTTWVTYQASNVYTFTGLNEETTYNIGGRIRADASGSGSDTYATDYVTATTPSDQAKARIKISGAWERGKVYFKHNGSWVKAKKLYRKINGQWVLGYNYDSYNIAVQQDMTQYTATFPSRGTVTYNSATGLNTLTVTGGNGWECYYTPISCVVGKDYDVSVYWRTPSGYTPYLTGIALVIYDSEPSNSPTISSQSDSNKVINLPSDTTGHVYTTRFRATSTTEYITFNFGGLQDGELYASSFEIKDLIITYNEH